MTPYPMWEVHRPPAEPAPHLSLGRRTVRCRPYLGGRGRCRAASDRPQSIAASLRALQCCADQQRLHRGPGCSCPFIATHSTYAGPRAYLPTPCRTLVL